MPDSRTRLAREGATPPLRVGQYSATRSFQPSSTLLATSMASNTNTCPGISGASQFPHLRDRGGSQLCGLPSPPTQPHSSPSGGGGCRLKTLSGKTGSVPACHLPQLWAWHLALVSPEGSPLIPQNPPGHLQVDKRGGLGGKQLEVQSLALGTC